MISPDSVPAGTLVTTHQVRSRLLEAQRDLKKASAAAEKTLNTGASRARTTTVHANWRAASEEWGRVFDWACALGFKELALEIGKPEVGHG